MHSKEGKTLQTFVPIMSKNSVSGKCPQLSISQGCRQVCDVVMGFILCMLDSGVCTLQFYNKFVKTNDIFDGKHNTV